MAYILRTKSGRTAIVRSDELARSERIAGLDPDGRIVVDDGDAQNPNATGISYTGWDGKRHTDPPFMFGLTLCCQASDKGTEDGICCRACYGCEPNADEGNYLYRAPDGTFPELDPIAALDKMADASP